MQIILLEKVVNLGNLGDLVKVKDGYARNFLIPQGKAKRATPVALKEFEANPAQGKSEAHRKAMMALMATPSQPEYAHPLFWAPFVVVGEGGRN